MKKSTSKKPLRLSLETIRQLDRELALVVGGKGAAVPSHPKTDCCEPPVIV